MNHNVIKFAAPKSVEDIAADWLIRMDGEPTLSPAEQAEFKRWINKDPKHKSEFMSLMEVWDNAPVEEIHQLLYAKKVTAPPKKSPIFKPVYMFCSMFFIAGLVFMFTDFSRFTQPESVYSSNGIYVTSIGQQQQYSLDDGSTVYLNTNSRVQVDYTDDNRNVWLIYGEAHFEVAKNPNKPFRVYAAGGRVEAVGTAFNVKLSDNLLDVLVTEGRVAMSAVVDKLIASPFSQTKTHEDVNQIDEMLSTVGTLDAGQRIKLDAVYQGQNGESPTAYNIETLSAQELQRQQAWRSGVLVFDGQPMSDFVHEVSRFTHASFIIEDPQVANLRVGGRYKIDKLDQVIVALEHTFNIQVSQVNQSTYLLSKKPEVKE
ncbi:FecR family protein [Aliiglaciecola lipolytica]|uniref:Transmembrane sensor n=1 Tax=Aliiglaciecola lipolytica E3 TaxID=1127673 RepID=K6YE72_9ALTE|nr:FecR domain-containing protein [Aliiglaciecola lipolytica]GAC16462.1 transmembrane sensor [Aliiglaciecola lipolytica E3]